MATSSSDGTACIWDLRSINVDQPKPLKEVSHNRAVQSAYFSPSGSSLATTSMDNTVGIVTGVNFEHISMIEHDIDNQINSRIASFRSHLSTVPRRLDAHPSTVDMLAGAACLGQVYMWTLG